MNIPTTFASPQFHLVPDRMVRNYANVSNRLEIAGRSSTWAAAVCIPTSLFTLTKSAWGVSPSDSMSLAIDEIQVEDDTAYLLSLLVIKQSGEESLYDLWTYSPASLPRWMFDRQYWVK